MKIVSAVTEMVPFVKTGGLAEVAGTLPHELRALGHDVISFLPRYRQIDLEAWGFKTVIDKLTVPMGSSSETGRVLHTVEKDGCEVYVIDHQEFFQRDELYGTLSGGYPDNDRRFAFFQLAVLETLRKIGFSPDLIHCHDWQTGLIPVFLKTQYREEPLFRKTRSVFTIHNLAYQGNFPPDSLPSTGIGWEHFKMDGLEFYGKVSYLKAGIVYADALTTVSERYAQEIQSREFGCGMEGVLQRRADRLHGVSNGIDYLEWDSASDRDLAANYTAEDRSSKAANKKALQLENGFATDPEVPVIGLISRLVDQKGLDILIPAMGEMPKLGVQFVLLGTGEDKYHKILREIAKKNKKHFGIHIVFDTAMAKRIYAGSDMMLVPSYYEPCGLGHMIALRFGTVPVARATGGLADSIREYDVRTGKGNGFLFDAYTPEALLEAVKRAIHVYKDSTRWDQLVKNAMTYDCSWKASAKRYMRIFEMTQRRKLEIPGK